MIQMFSKNSVVSVLLIVWGFPKIQTTGTGYKKKYIGGPGCGALSSVINRRSPQVFNPDPSFHQTSYIPIIIRVVTIYLTNVLKKTVEEGAWEIHSDRLLG